MKEKLIIKNFGPIKSVDIELGKMTILIGEQATGKSTIAKVLAVCKYFSYIVEDEFYTGYASNSFIDGLEAWGLKGMIKAESLIEYYSKEYNLLVQNESAHDIIDQDSEGHPIYAEFTLFTPKITWKSEKFQKLLNDLETLKPKENGKYSLNTLFFQIPPSFYQNNVLKIMDNPFYFPTERGLQSIFSLGRNSIQNLSDSLFNQFARLDQILKNYSKETQIKPLEIYYKNENGQGFVKKQAEEKYYTLTNGASGYQSTIPIVLAVKYYNEQQKRARTFIVEEPELNLFPKAQKKLIEFFVESINLSSSNFLLPTHSPYTLSSLNNLMYAFYVGNLNDGKYKDVVKGIIDDNFWLDPNEVAAYHLTSTGESRNIVDRNENLIMTDFIDSVSEIISEEFDKLLSIEIGLKNDK